MSHSHSVSERTSQKRAQAGNQSKRSKKKKKKKTERAYDLLGVQQTQIQRPCDTASTLEGDSILDRHEFEVDTLDGGPDLPVGKDGGDVDLDI